MRVHFKLPKQRYLSSNYLIQNVREVSYALDDVEGKPNVLVLVAFNCKTIMHQEGSVGIIAIVEVYLSIDGYPIIAGGDHN